MKLSKTILAICALAFAPLAMAQSGGVPNYQVIPNYSGIGAGQQFRNDINNHLSGVTPIAPRIVTIFYSQLPPEQDGQQFYLRDGTAGNPCTGGGHGAYAFGEQGVWVCSGSAITNTLLEGTAACAGPPTIGNLLAVNGSGVWCDTAAPAMAGATLNPGATQSAVTANLHAGAAAPLVLLSDANANAIETLLQANTAGHTGVCSLVEQSDGSVTLTCSKLVSTGNATVGGTLGVTGNATFGGTLGVTGAATFGSTLGLTGAFTWNAGAPDLSELNAPRMPLTFYDPLSTNGALVAQEQYTPSVGMHIRGFDLALGIQPSSCTTNPAYEVSIGGTAQAASKIATVNLTTKYHVGSLALAVAACQDVSITESTAGVGCAGPGNANLVLEMTSD